MITKTTITKKDTSETAVKSFLEEIKDYNPAHWKKRVFPGMFALRLLENRITRPIQEVHATFSGLRLFPLEMSLETEERNGATHFRYSSRGDSVYEGSFHYDLNREKIPTSERLSPVYLVGGELQREYQGSEQFGKGNVGLYSRQSMNFKDGNTGINVLSFEEPEQAGKRSYEIPVIGKRKDDSIGAEGKAGVTVIPEKLFHRLIEMEEQKAA